MLSGSRLFFRSLRLAAALGVGFVAFAVVCNWLVSRGASLPASRAAAAADARDAAIVPGTFASGGRPGPLLRARLETARTALLEGRVHKILVSGNEQVGETTVMRTWLEHRGVDRSRILVDPEGTRTIETMHNGRHRFGIKSALVCTEEPFMGRTLYLARAEGIDAAGVASDVALPADMRWRGREVLKSTLAVFETTLGVRLPL